MIVTRFAFFSENSVIRSHSITKISAQGTTVPVRLLQQALVILSSNMYRNLGPSESACRHYADPNPVPLLLADSIGRSREELEVIIQAQGSSVALTDHVHRPHSL